MEWVTIIFENVNLVFHVYRVMNEKNTAVISVYEPNPYFAEE